MSKENRVSDERLSQMRTELDNHGAAKLATIYTADYVAALRELQSLRSKPVAGVEVKPLEWHGPDVNDEIYARSALCVYTIQKQRKSMGFWLTEVGGNYASIDEAKAAAAADYRQRILSALLPKATATVVSEPLTLDDDDLETILAIGMNEQSGRVTNYELKELVRVYRGALKEA